MLSLISMRLCGKLSDIMWLVLPQSSLDWMCGVAPRSSHEITYIPSFRPPVAWSVGMKSILFCDALLLLYYAWNSWIYCFLYARTPDISFLFHWFSVYRSVVLVFNNLAHKCNYIDTILYSNIHIHIQSFICLFSGIAEMRTFCTSHVARTYQRGTKL